MIFAGDSLLPFYIGIAQEPKPTNRHRREFDHVREAKGGYSKANYEKSRFILSCLKQGITFRYEYERGLTIAEAYAREIALIAEYGRCDIGTGCLFNRDSGGRGGRDMLPSTREKIRQANIGRQISPETRVRMSAWQIGKIRGPRTAEVKEKVAAKQRGVPRKRWTEERRASQAATVTANPYRHTPEIKAQISRTRLERKIRHTEETKAIIRAKRATQTIATGREHPRFGTGKQDPDALNRAEACRRYRDRRRGKDVPLISRKGLPGRKLSPEAIARITAKNLGQKRSAEARAKMRQAKLGTKASEQTKAKMRASQLLRWERRRTVQSATFTHSL